MAWNDTASGAAMDGAFQTLLQVYNSTVPGHVQSLNTLSNRPITG